MAAIAPSVDRVTAHPGKPSSNAVAPCAVSSDGPRAKDPSGLMVGVTTDKRGKIASIGMTAISWVKRTAKLDRPPAVCINPFSESVCNTIAVEDSERIMPIAILDCHAKPKMLQATAISMIVNEICIPPNPINFLRMSHSVLGVNSRPITKSIMTTPNSAKCCRSCVSLPTKPKTGPMTKPANR